MEERLAHNQCDKDRYLAEVFFKKHKKLNNFFLTLLYILLQTEFL